MRNTWRAERGVRRYGLPALVLTAAVLLLPAYTTKSNGSGSRSLSGSLSFYVLTPPSNLDPYTQLPGLQGMLWTGPLYDTLTLLQPDYTVKPLLATSWKLGKAGGKRYIELSLRHGLKFPDGSPFNASTVSASIHRSQSLTGSLTAADVKGAIVEERGTYDVRIYAGNAYSMPRLLAGPAGMMISQKAIANGVNLSTHPSGIGMFQLKQFTPTGVTYTATPNYWDKAAQKLATLQINTSSNTTATLNLMKTGGPDIAYLDPSLDSTVGNIGYKPVTAPIASTYGFAINTSIKPFNDVNVRKAMAMAIDRQGICKAVLFGECTVNSQLYPPNVDGYNKNVPAIQYNPTAAKQLISAAGATGTKVTLINVAGPAKFAALTQAVQAEWNAIGLDTTIVTMPQDQVTTAFGINHTAAVAFVAFGAFSDPSQAVTTYMLTTSIYNPGKLFDPVIPKLYGQALKTPDAAASTQAWQQISAQAAKDYLQIPVLTPKLMYWVKSGVTGFKPPITVADPLWRGLGASK